MASRHPELSRAVPITAAYALVMASLYVLKPVRNALFLTNIGVEDLPYVLLLVALVGGLATGVYGRFTGSVSIDRLVLWTYLFLATGLLLFWVVLHANAQWIFYAFYVWVSLYGVTATSLVWLLANTLFNPREARRWFGFMGVGGIIGAILGGALTDWIAPRVGTENLPLICIGFLLLSLVLLRSARLSEGLTQPKTDHAESPLSYLARLPLLRNLCWMASLVAIVSTIVDVQFNAEVSRAFPDKDAKTAFFGSFFATLSGLALVVQILLTPRILRSVSAATAALFLPVGLALGSASLFLLPGLLSGILAKGMDGGLRHSIHKSATEILFLPLPHPVKQSTKVFLDVTVDSLSTGAGALLVLLLTKSFGLDYQHLSLVALLLIATWIAVVFRTRSAYLCAFRKALERRELDLKDSKHALLDTSLLESLVSLLHSGNERQLVYALDLFTSVKNERWDSSIRPLLRHESAEVRRKALGALGALGALPAGHEALGVTQITTQDLASVEPLLDDEDAGVRIEALHFFLRESPENRVDRLRVYLSGSDLKRQLAALVCIAEYGGAEEKSLVTMEIISNHMARSGTEGVFARVAVSRVLGLGILNAADTGACLGELLLDFSPAVILQTIESAGRLQHPELVSWLLQRLAETNYRSEARRALAAYGTKIVAELEKQLLDDTSKLSLRRQVVRVFAEIPSQESADALLSACDKVETAVRREILKSLNRLRARYATLSFDKVRVGELLLHRARALFEIIEIDELLRDDPHDPVHAVHAVLRKALREKQEGQREELFRLLALRYPPKDIFDAFHALTGGSAQKRANALEFLDNILSHDLKMPLMALFEDPLDAAGAEKRRRIFERSVATRDEALAALLRGPDAWLKACAICRVRGPDELRSRAIHDLLTAAQADPHPLVQGTADLP